MIEEDQSFLVHHSKWNMAKIEQLFSKYNQSTLITYVVLCHRRTVPSSEPEMIRGRRGWKQTVDTF